MIGVVGAVVGQTYPKILRSLHYRLPFLIQLAFSQILSQKEIKNYSKMVNSFASDLNVYW